MVCTFVTPGKISEIDEKNTEDKISNLNINHVKFEFRDIYGLKEEYIITSQSSDPPSEIEDIRNENFFEINTESKFRTYLYPNWSKIKKYIRHKR